MAMAFSSSGRAGAGVHLVRGHLLERQVERLVEGADELAVPERLARVVRQVGLQDVQHAGQ